MPDRHSYHFRINIIFPFDNPFPLAKIQLSFIFDKETLLEFDAPWRKGFEKNPFMPTKDSAVSPVEKYLSCCLPERDGRMIKELIHCMDCHQVFPNYDASEFSRAKSLPGVEWNDEDLAKGKEFLTVHCGHRMEKLSLKLDSGISSKPSYEPLRETYFLAGSGERKFLIRRTKTALNQLASYEIVPGRLQVFNVSLRIQEEDLARQMAADSGLSQIPRQKVQGFIEAFREEIARFSPEAFGEVAESIEEGENSLQAFGSLKEFVWKRILDRGCGDWDGFERGQIQRFIDENRDPPQVLSLRIERRISILSLVEKGIPEDLEDRKESAPVAEAQFSLPAQEKVEKGRF